MENFGKKFIEEHPDTFREMEEQLGDPEKLSPIVSFENIERSCSGNETLEHLYAEMVDYCERYTETVARFQELILRGVDFENRETKEWIDGERKSVHDAMIDSVNILARNLAKEGKDASWITRFGKSRAAYGNFALQNTYSLLIKEFNNHESQ